MGNTTTKINYYNQSISQYRRLRRENNNKKPKLLLHVCCGACSCYPLVFLCDLFDVTILFSNSNIYPYEEHEKRLEALKKYVRFVNKEFGSKIKIICDFYDYDSFRKDLLPFKDEPEHGQRCKLCIKKRMERVFEFAKENNFKLVTTVMTISRNKDVEYLNTLGVSLSKKYDCVEYFVSDFKKNNGQDCGVALSKLIDIYRQDYCGCEFSYREE